MRNAPGMDEFRIEGVFPPRKPPTCHLAVKNPINALNKRANRRDEVAANHSHGLLSVPVVSEDDRLTFDQLSSPRVPSPRVPVLGTFNVYRTFWKDIADSWS